MNDKAPNLPPASDLTRAQIRQALHEYDYHLGVLRQRRLDLADNAKIIVDFNKEKAK
jgi:hypothetical protein